MCRSYQLGPALLMLSAKEVKTFSELGRESASSAPGGRAESGALREERETGD